MSGLAFVGNGVAARRGNLHDWLHVGVVDAFALLLRAFASLGNTLLSARDVRKVLIEPLVLRKAFQFEFELRYVDDA